MGQTFENVQQTGVFVIASLFLHRKKEPRPKMFGQTWQKVFPSKLHNYFCDNLRFGLDSIAGLLFRFRPRRDGCSSLSLNTSN